MHFVDEENGAGSVPRQFRPSLVDHRAHVLDPGADRGQLDEVAPGGPAEDVCDRGLPGAWRPPQHERHRLVVLDQLPKWRPLDEQLLLADDLLECPWANPDRERSALVAIVGAGQRSWGRGRTAGHFEQHTVVAHAHRG